MDEVLLALDAKRRVVSEKVAGGLISFPAAIP